MEEWEGQLRATYDASIRALDALKNGAANEAYASLKKQSDEAWELLEFASGEFERHIEKHRDAVQARASGA